MKSTAALILAIGITFGGAAHAADAYAVVSLVGDAITIVRHEAGTGSLLDRNDQEQVALGDGLFDEIATRVTANTIHRTLPDARLQIIALPDRSAFGDTTSLFAADGGLPALLSAVRPLLRAPDTRYLVVVGKWRGDAELRVRNGTIGSGKLAGLGFYLDPVKRMKRSETGERGTGFVAPFAYVQVALVDLRSGAIVRSERETETTTRANVGPDATLDPWDALTAEQKIRALRNLLARALQKAVPRVVAPG